MLKLGFQCCQDSEMVSTGGSRVRSSGHPVLGIARFRFNWAAWSLEGSTSNLELQLLSLDALATSNRLRLLRLPL